jgi:hypothetical protein
LGFATVPSGFLSNSYQNPPDNPFACSKSSTNQFASAGAGGALGAADTAAAGAVGGGDAAGAQAFANANDPSNAHETAAHNVRSDLSAIDFPILRLTFCGAGA